MFADGVIMEIMRGLVKIEGVTEPLEADRVNLVLFSGFYVDCLE